MADGRADDMCNRKKQEFLVALKQKDLPAPADRHHQILSMITNGLIPGVVAALP